MVRRAFTLLFIILSATGFCEESYLGMFLQGQRVGYASTVVQAGKFPGGAVKKIDSKTVFGVGMLNDSMKTVVNGTTYLDRAGKTISMRLKVESAGRSQSTQAAFTSKGIELEIDNNGTKSKRTLAYPTDAPIVDDPVSLILADPALVPKLKHCYVLDPLTASLVKNTVESKGKVEVELPGGVAQATLIEVREPRATLRAYIGADGAILKIEGPMGIEMRPMSKAEALAEADPNAKKPDLAEVTAIKPNRPIDDARNAKSVSLFLMGADLSLLPSDAFQTVQRESSGWKLVVHPVRMNASATIAEARKAYPQWTLPSLNVSSNAREIRATSRNLVKRARTVAEAASRIREGVYRMMTPNAGIGVLRDAKEVLTTQVGVCRDYAMLTAALLRAAGVPCRLASGLVYMNGQYYYHAWAEVWDTRHWVGVDSTLPTDGVGADHVKLAHGNVEDAFTFTFLDKVKITVLDVKR